MKCKTCGGKKFIELEHGLIQRKCPDCEGTGEDLSNEEMLRRAEDLLPSEELSREEIAALLPVEVSEVEKASHDDAGDSGAGPDNRLGGGADTGEHQKPSKPKARKKAATGVS